MLSLLLLLFAGKQAVAGETTLNSMCNFLGGDYVNYDYCVSTLSSDPVSATADGHTLAVIAVNLTAANATAVRSLADSLSVSASNDSFVRASLQNCSSLYAAASPDLLRSFAAVAARNYTAATTALSAVLRVPAGCDEAFAAAKEGAAVASPIRKENNAFSDLATLAKAVNNYLAQ
ncbi:hypothetical protein KSP40_PGU009932 [Platanthera guangdongensis]|uniref:Pectinesterase inhibitor domain-containing protein n=1 Tax=Platanthera guangdongensis TaxID=2320717 RepID=A0ABR2LU90_9ASPA